MKMDKIKKKNISKNNFVLATNFMYFFVPVIVYSAASLPVLYFLFYILPFFNFSNPLNILVLPFLGIFVIFFFIVFEIAVPGFFINILRLKYGEGEYDVQSTNKIFLKMSLFHLLYFFPIKLLDTFNLFYLKKMFLILIGMKIGKNTTIGTVGVYFMDPCLVEIGDNCYIGSYSVMTSHLIDQKKMITKKISIGNNCIIGGESLILPGVRIEDEVTVGNKSLVTTNKLLERGKIYGGIPAKEIK